MALIYNLYFFYLYFLCFIDSASWVVSNNGQHMRSYFFGDARAPYVIAGRVTSLITFLCWMLVLCCVRVCLYVDCMRACVCVCDLVNELS